MDAQATSIGSLIDSLATLRDQRREVDKKSKELAAAYAELEAQVMARLDSEDATKASGRKATASISETVVATVDWELAWKLIPKQPQLMQRRISDAGFRELFERKGEKFMAKYGLTPFVKRSLNLRVL